LNRDERLSATSLFDFKDKILVIMKAVGFSLNDFDLVVCSLDATVVDLETAAGKDTVAVGFQPRISIVWRDLRKPVTE
jgi:hypothetical protein